MQSQPQQQPQPPLPPAPQSGVSSCYVFKSRLQEYAQKVNLPTPVYETTKEGPSHEPTFRSTVILGDARYDSLLGFFNRKAAEQSAAEVALLALSKSNEVSEGVSPPVHETGLCKNLLQEYAQKLNYAIPLYECQKVDDSRGRVPFFSCTVEIGGIRYIGAAARTKKEAEIKAARTALLAIQASDPSSNLSVKTDLTVLPCKKRGPETIKTEDAVKPPKHKKARFKKRQMKKRLNAKTGFNNDRHRIAEEPNVSGTNAVEPQGDASTKAVPEEIQLIASNFNSGLDDNKLRIAKEPDVSMADAVEPQVAATSPTPTEALSDEIQFQLKASNFNSSLDDNKLGIAKEPDVSMKKDAVELQVAALPEKTQFQLKESNFMSGFKDNKLEIAEKPNFSAVESQVAALSEPVANVIVSQVLPSPSLNLGNHIASVADGCGSSLIGEVKEVAVPNLPTGNGNHNDIGAVEGVSSVADGCGGSCFSEVKEEVNVVMQAASDTA